MTPFIVVNPFVCRAEFGPLQSMHVEEQHYSVMCDLSRVAAANKHCRWHKRCDLAETKPSTHDEWL